MISLIHAGIKVNPYKLNERQQVPSNHHSRYQQMDICMSRPSLNVSLKAIEWYDVYM